MFVRLGRGSVAVDPAATTGPTISLQESRETEMNSLVDLPTGIVVLGAINPRSSQTAGQPCSQKPVFWPWLQNSPGTATTAIAVVHNESNSAPKMIRDLRPGLATRSIA